MEDDEGDKVENIETKYEDQQDKNNEMKQFFSGL